MFDVDFGSYRRRMAHRQRASCRFVTNPALDTKSCGGSVARHEPEETHGVPRAR